MDRASDVKVRTTPFTCGCHASVATRTRIRPLWMGIGASIHCRIACDNIAISYINRVTAVARMRKNLRKCVTEAF
jgi:hypothetical protein